MQYEPHEYANLFPMMADGEIAALINDMRENGYDDTAPIVIYHGKILDGRNRYKAAQIAGVTPTFDTFDGKDALGFVIRHNLNRRHLNESQRAVVAGRIETLHHGGGRNFQDANLHLEKEIYRKDAAEMLNVSPRTVATVKAVERAAPELIEKIERGEMTAHEAQKTVKAQEKQAKIKTLEELAERQQAKSYDGFSVNDVFVCDIAAIKLEAQSVDMIFTDPPYHDEYIDLYGQLAKFSAHVLKPGAYVMAYCGKAYLNQIMRVFDDAGLEYVWTFGVYQPDNNQKFMKHNIFEAWRPIIAYKQKGKTATREWQPDMIKGTRDKSFHEWQQQIEPALKWIGAYTLPNDLVADPFVGGGTTVAACKELKRNFIAFDKEAKAVKITKERISK